MPAHMKSLHTLEYRQIRANTSYQLTCVLKGFPDPYWGVIKIQEKHRTLIYFHYLSPPGAVSCGLWKIDMRDSIPLRGYKKRQLTEKWGLRYVCV